MISIAVVFVAFSLLSAVIGLDRRVYYVAWAFSLVFLGSIRWEVGSDWQSYFGYFDSNNLLLDFTGGEIPEIGHAVYTYLIKSIFNSFTVYLLFQSIVVIWCNFYIMYKYTKGSYLVVLLFFLNSIGNIYFVRQTVAASIMLLAFNNLSMSRYIRSIFQLICAASFHYSALIFFPAWFFRVKSKLFTITLMTLVGVLFYFLFDNYLTEKINLYFISNVMDEFYEENYGGLSELKIFWVCYLLFVGFLYWKYVGDGFEYRNVVGSLFVAYILFFILGYIIPQINRLGQYLSIFEIITIALVFKEISPKFRIILIFPVAVLFIARYYYRISAWPGETDLYKSILF